MSCGMKAKKLLNPTLRDSIIYLSPFYLYLNVRSPPARARALGTPQSSPDEREEQCEDARDREDRAQALLRDTLRGLISRTGQRHAGELVYEARPQRGGYDRQNYRDHQRQQGHQEPVLDPGAARHPPRDIAPDEEGNEECQEQADEPGDTAARRAVSDAEGREDAANYGTHDAAQDQARPKRGEPAENHADPACPQLGLPPLAVGRALLAHVLYLPRRGFLSPVRHFRSPPHEKNTIRFERFFSIFVDG